MRSIVRGSLLGKYFSELHQLQRTLDFACGKEGTSKELLTHKIIVQRLRTRVIDQSTRVHVQLE